ncbi:MAG: winged helix-turn-helix domain-containing protein, partial [Candidatus Binataceae bacterium]
MALAAQGFADARQPLPPGVKQLRRVFDRIGVVQIDSVNVLVRSHYLPLFSRMGPYSSKLLDTASYGPPPARELFEYWGHMASLLPMEFHPLLRWRMAAAKRMEWGRGSIARPHRRRPRFARSVLKEISDRGPISAGELSDGGPSRGGWWGWSDGKTVLEWLFASGQVCTSSRRGFKRLYDLPERVLPREVLEAPTPTQAQAQRELVRIAARALGVASERDLCDYFRIALAPGKRRIQELVETGELIPAAVEGWTMPAFADRPARSPGKVDAQALLSPFDSLIWERSRTERVFGFRYRIEIYTPAARRVHGYYVLPFLLGDRLVARVDLKSDRAAKTLQVLAAYA